VCVNICIMVGAYCSWCSGCAVGWMGWASNPSRGKRYISCLKNVQSSSGAHPASCSVDNQGIYLQNVKWPGHVADHSLPFSAEDRSEGA